MRNFRKLLTAAVFLCVAPVAAFAQTLPAPWVAVDVGAPTLSGAAATNGSGFRIDAAGTDIWGSSDQFHFLYQQVSGDVEVIARVDSLVQTDPWAKAAVMIRGSLNANATHGSAVVSAAQGIHFQRRLTTGGTALTSAGPGGAAPIWLRVVRAGTVVTAYSSTNSTSWTTLGSETIGLGTTAYVGVAVTSHNPNMRTTAEVSAVTVTPGGVPTSQQSMDIGAPAIAGQTTFSSGTFTVRAAGRDIWDTNDQFHFVYQPMSGDVEVIARVAGLVNVDNWAKAGVMLREALTPDSRNAFMALSAGNGLTFQRRANPGGMSVFTAGGGGTAPVWVRLVRSGNLFQAYRSPDGVTWSNVGSDTLVMGATVYVGLAVTSHNTAASTTATIDNLTVRSSTVGNQPPAVTITQPSSGTSYQLPATIAVAANATDPENRMLSVDFYANSTLITRDTSAPYSISWAPSSAGVYSLSATAHDADGGSSTSSAVSVTVTASANQAPTVSLTAPAAGATFTAPAAINLAANASDPEGQVARVEFFNGATLLNADATAPYAFTWSNVAAGTYDLTAVVQDAAGLRSTSTSVTVTVSPSGSGGALLSADIGSPSIAGSTTVSGNAYTVRAAGSDIWDGSDQFRFVYRAVSGDVEVIARVSSLTNTDGWAKAGVMIRETVAANSRHASTLLTPGYGRSFQRRVSTGGASTHTTPNTGSIPGWIRIVRTGNLFQSYGSSDGSTWTAIGSETISMAAAIYVGVAVTSHNVNAATTAVFDSIVINAGGGANTPPSVTLTSPTSGATFVAPATVSLAANASDSGGQITRVEFFAGTTQLGADTTAPYTFTWSNVAAGSYTLTAVAYDNGGASASSAAVTITVSSGSAPPTGVMFSASADHATNVTSYLLKIYAQGADPATATPVGTSDLGKPTPAANNEITVDRSSFFAGLPAANYIATVTAIGPGGQTTSASVSFVR
jgi:regulation of enolase protein 1 (concanavalin A-like superfamily)